MSLNLKGKFACTLGKGVLNEAATGSLMYTVEVLIADAEGGAYPALRYNFVLVNKDGEMMQKNVEKIIGIVGRDQWDGTDIGVLESLDPSGMAAVATCDDREYQGKLYTEVKWLDPVGGGGMGLPEAVDAKSVAAKYGSKFRAAFGGKSSVATKPAPAPAAKKAPPPPSAKKAPPPPSATGGAVSSMNTCWSELNAKLSEKPDTAIADQWNKMLAETFPGIGAGDMTPSQWGAMSIAIAAITAEDLPF